MFPLNMMVQDVRGLPRSINSGDGLPASKGIKSTALTTAGAGTLLAGLLTSGLLLRTGPGGAVADTIDTAANLDAAFPNAAVGDALEVIYSNNVAFAITITAAAGVTLRTAATNNVVAANTTVRLLLIKTGTATYDLFVLS